jgi:MFS family permease
MVRWAVRLGGLPQGLAAFRHRNFRLFWIGQLVSLVGTWMQQVAQSWLILQLTGDPVALGAVAAAQFTPVLVLGLFAGVVADAVPKRNALVATQVGALVLALVLGLLVAAGSVQVWHVFLLAALLGVVNAFDMPIRQSFVVEMVGREDVANAVALNSAVFNGTRIIGPAIAGLLIATVGIAVCFFLNAATYVAVIIGLVAMRSSEFNAVGRAAVQRTVRSVVDSLAEGLRYVRDERTVRLGIAVLGIVATVALNFQVLLPLLAQNVLGGGAETFGFLMAASGIGSLASSLAIAFGQRPTTRLLLVGALVIGVAAVGLAISRSLPVSLVLMLITGWGTIAMAATTNTLIQLTTPDELRGRVMSVYTTVFAGSVPLGGLFAGSMAAAFDAPTAIGLGGVLAIVTVAAAAWWVRGGRGRPAPLTRGAEREAAAGGAAVRPR